MKTSVKCDLHIHSQFSDGHKSIRELVDIYGSQNFGAIAITDHLCERANFIGRISHHLKYSLNRSNFDHYMDTIKREADYAWKKYEMLLIPGFEISKNSLFNQRSAHIVVLNVTEFIDPDLPVSEILYQAKSKGGFTIAAHPFHTGEFEFQTFHLWSQRSELSSLIDAWEVNYRHKIVSELRDSGLPLIANSDFHHQKHWTSWKTKVNCELNTHSLFQNIKEQRIQFFLDSTCQNQGINSEFLSLAAL